MRDKNITRKIVRAWGNMLNRGEEPGVHAWKGLEAHLAERAAELEFLDGGAPGLNRLPWVEEASHLLVLDAVNARKGPGPLIELQCDEIPLFTGIKLPDHQVTLQEVPAPAQFRGKLPQPLHLIGIQPADISTGVDLSPPLAAILPQVVEAR